MLKIAEREIFQKCSYPRYYWRNYLFEVVMFQITYDLKIMILMTS